MKLARYATFVALALVPVVIAGWIVWKGRHPAPTPPLAERAAPAPDEDSVLRSLVQSPIGPAQAKGAAAFYGRENLFDYVNGAAPGYLEKGFRRLAAVELSLAGGSDLVCDVFDMSAAANAAAMAAAERSPSAEPIEGWPEAWRGKLAFVFHEGRYLVKLTAFDAEAEAALPAVAREVAERIR